MIFYVSGTGNTRWAVEQIAKATGEDIINIGKISSAPYQCRLSEGERIGFCFPVHGWRPTKVMREFIGHLQIENAEGHYCYALCTAGDNIGMTMNILQQDLKRNRTLCKQYILSHHAGIVYRPALHGRRHARARKGKNRQSRNRATRIYWLYRGERERDSPARHRTLASHQ
jgi:flavodoxin